MEIKEVVVNAIAPSGRGVRIKDEIWHIVKFGDREFLMPKTASKKFTKNMRHDTVFYFYFDGNNLITNNTLHIPVGTMAKNLDERYFVVLKDNVELFEPENYILLAKENGLALYMMKNYTTTYYKDGNVYREVDRLCIPTTITFYKEKPFNEETYNLLQKVPSYNDTKIIRINKHRTLLKVRIHDYNDLKVYATEDAYKYRIFLIENAEFAKIGSVLHVAFKGDQTYMMMDNFYMSIETTGHNNEYEGYECIIPDTTKVLHKELREYIDEGKIVFVESSITEIPSANSEIIVRKVIRKAEPLIKRNPAKLSYKLLEPKIVEEKTYKIKDFVNKPAELEWRVIAMFSLGLPGILFVLNMTYIIANLKY